MIIPKFRVDPWVVCYFSPLFLSDVVLLVPYFCFQVNTECFYLSVLIFSSLVRMCSNFLYQKIDVSVSATDVFV